MMQTLKRGLALLIVLVGLRKRYTAWIKKKIAEKKGGAQK